MLVGPQAGGCHERIHDDYLRFFWEEEFDVPKNPLQSSQSRGMVRRDKILAYVARTYTPNDPSSTQNTFSTIFRGYSGYVHGAAVHILDIFDGQRFQTPVAPGETRHDSAVKDFMNYPPRCISAGFFVALSFKDQAAMDRMRTSSDRLFGWADEA